MMTKKTVYRRLKRVLVFLIGLVGIIFVAAYVTIWWLSKPLPVGQSGPAADSLARVMLEAVNDSAWQEVGAISWNFAGKHRHLWDKKRHLARVQWKDFTVLLDLSKRDGVVLKSGKMVPRSSGEHQTRIQQAWEYWCNDSFWLNPISKVFDEGVQRSLVELDNGASGLLVTYVSGGVTPGDSYLWHIGEDGLPVAWQMWVKIIPIRGLTATWENWLTLPEGAKIATLHRIFSFKLQLSEIKSGKRISEIEPDVDPFALLWQGN